MRFARDISVDPNQDVCRPAAGDGRDDGLDVAPGGLERDGIAGVRGNTCANSI